MVEGVTAITGRWFSSGIALSGTKHSVKMTVNKVYTSQARLSIDQNSRCLEYASSQIKHVPDKTGQTVAL